MNDKNNTHTYATNEDIEVVYNLVNYYKRIPNYATITTLPEENVNYIKEALPNVTSCSSMLKSCRELTSVDTTGWDTSKIECMSLMFYACEALETLDVSKWDTSKVTNMSCMFSGCNKLTTLDVSKWNTNNVIDMYSMFSGCSELKTLDISDWDTSNVKYMHCMFNGCKELTTIKGIIDMKSCTYYDDMFYDCTKLTGVKIKNPPEDFEIYCGLTKDQYEIVE